MVAVDKIECTVHENMPYGPVNEDARISISSMSSSELLRFGVCAKFRCSQGSSPNDHAAADRVAQLDEARAEWNRRHPGLPLRDSF
jgi:hypothetical protein